MKKAIVFTLGCKVNQCESQEIVNLLNEFDFCTAVNLGHADLYIINTCSVTNEADKKSRQAIARAKKFNNKADIIVIGCSVEKGFEDRDGIVLIGQKNKIEQLRKHIKTNFCFSPAPMIYSSAQSEGFSVHSKKRPMIKIQDGCNRFCSYCIVPYLRGRSVSRPIDEIIREVEILRLAQDGFNGSENLTKEIVLVGIDISSYDHLLTLIKELGNNFKKDFRFRLGSLEQSVITHEFLSALEQNNFCEHFHLSLQSGSDTVLERMNRHYTTKQFLEKMHLIREYFPSASITTDIIAGFPNETEAEHSQTLDLIEQAKFSNIHAFPFSARQGTKAFDMDGQLSSQIKKERANKIIEIAKRHRQNFFDKNIGQTQEVFVEERLDSEYNAGYTRSYIRVRTKEKIGALRKIQINKESIIHE